MDFQLKKFQELSLEELYAILRLRSIVFVVEQDCVYNDIDNLDQKAWHLFLSEGGEIVAYCRILGPGIYFSETMIGRVITSKEIRNKGYGKLIMKHAIDTSFRLFANAEIRIMGQCYLQKFYEDLGFVVDGEEFLEDGIPHIEMILSQKK